MGISNSVDAKIKDLENSNADLQNIQLDVRQLKESLGLISERYDILEKKNEIIDKTVINVDNAFEKLKDIERRLENCNRTSGELPDRISSLKTEVDTILENIPKVKDAIGKLDSLDAILSETEKRIDTLQDDKEWLASTETRLDNLNREVTSKLRTLGEVSKNTLPKTSSKSSITPSTRETVVTLAHQGWTPENIADKLKLSVGEVELILGTYQS